MKRAVPTPPRPIFELTRPRRVVRLFSSTGTRILLLYAVTLLGMMALAVPVFRALLFAQVDERVRRDLQEEMEDFQQTYRVWDSRNAETEAALRDFLRNFLADEVPEDDNFHIVIFDGEFYAAKPTPLPSLLQPGSQLMQRWLDTAGEVEETVAVADADVGSVLYKTYVLEVQDQPRGLFVAAHLAGGERAEAWASIDIFLKVAGAVVAGAFLLAWIASRQLLRPVQQLAATAKTINEHTLSQRLPVTGTGELSELAATFNTMMNRVQTAFDSQRSFISDAGHELRTPLTIIQGHLELMGEDPAEQAEALDIVMDELKRMGRFINDLLLLAKAEQPDFLQPEPLELRRFMQEVSAKAAVLGERDWQLAVKTAGQFWGDRQRLTGALINLAQNAVQHTAPGDEIVLGATLDSQQVHLWVRDTGMGIRPEDQQRIFARFARAAQSRRRSDGAGLGLAIVQAIAAAHRGEVTLVSQPGSGSTFTLSFPVHPSESP